MHLLYLDDSGSVDNRNEQYLVLGGVSLFEAQANWVTHELDAIAESIDPENPQNVEFHASEIFSGRSHPWDKMTSDERRGVIKAVLKVFANSYDSARAFVCAVHKASYPGTDSDGIGIRGLMQPF